MPEPRALADNGTTYPWAWGHEVCLEVLLCPGEATGGLAPTVGTLRRMDRTGRLRIGRTMGNQPRNPESEAHLFMGGPEQRSPMLYARVASHGQQERSWVAGLPQTGRATGLIPEGTGPASKRGPRGRDLPPRTPTALRMLHRSLRDRWDDPPFQEGELGCRVPTAPGPTSPQRQTVMGPKRPRPSSRQGPTGGAEVSSLDPVAGIGVGRLPGTYSVSRQHRGLGSSTVH
jgi:hypothetical protein